jgi:RimJ/RimL family protein N-acetyltransferase
MSRVDHWPLFGLRVRTPRIELRYPSDDDVAEIAQRSVTDGIHDPAWMPFAFEWTDVAPPLQQRHSMQFHWGLRANWQPEHWHCNFVVVERGRIVGTQSAEATEFARLGEATTGSFLLRPEQGRGLGTEMRAAALHLGFAGLGAIRAETAAWEDNPSSQAVTRKLGYTDHGWTYLEREGARRRMLRYALTREEWEAGRRDDIAVHGLEPCLPLLGLDS